VRGTPEYTQPIWAALERRRAGIVPDVLNGAWHGPRDKGTFNYAIISQARLRCGPTDGQSLTSGLNPKIGRPQTISMDARLYTNVDVLGMMTNCN
jgi:hypothetical protein